MRWTVLWRNILLHCYKIIIIIINLIQVNVAKNECLFSCIIYLYCSITALSFSRRTTWMCISEHRGNMETENSNKLKLHRQTSNVKPLGVLFSLYQFCSFCLMLYLATRFCNCSMVIMKTMVMIFTEKWWARMVGEGGMQPEVCWSSSVTMPKPNCDKIR